MTDTGKMFLGVVLILLFAIALAAAVQILFFGAMAQKIILEACLAAFSVLVICFILFGVFGAISLSSSIDESSQRHYSQC